MQTIGRIMKYCSFSTTCSSFLSYSLSVAFA
nr:MAG TPA: hypothetical protein [Caudoviricetes sp.]